MLRHLQQYHDFADSGKKSDDHVWSRKVWLKIKVLDVAGF